MQWFIDKEHDGMLIRDYLREVHAFSRRILTSIKFDGGQILVNGLPKMVTYRLKVDDQLKVCFPPEKKGYYMQPEELPLEVVYEDEYIIVLNKGSGIATIPSSHNPSGTIANGLLYYYEQHNIQSTIHVVTRLDRNTSGILLIAKNRYIHSLLSNLIAAGKIKRKYKAIIEGQLEHKKDTIMANIGRKKDSIIERAVVEDGKRAVTHYEVIHTTEHHTLVDIELETGRTHQIRVHFSHIGHSLAGDNLYGGSTNLIDRQALHCYAISFEHPITKQNMTFHVPIPNDMKELMKS